MSLFRRQRRRPLGCCDFRAWSSYGLTTRKYRVVLSIAKIAERLGVGTTMSVYIPELNSVRGCNW